MRDLHEPIDPVHAECLATRNEIRQHVRQIRTTIQHWQPRPCPPRKEYP